MITASSPHLLGADGPTDAIFYRTFLRRLFRKYDSCLDAIAAYCFAVGVGEKHRHFLIAFAMVRVGAAADDVLKP